MATSSITRNFVIESEEQQSRQSRSWTCSPNTIEESYQESLTRKEGPIEFYELKGAEFDEFMERWNTTHGESSKFPITESLTGILSGSADADEEKAFRLAEKYAAFD